MLDLSGTWRATVADDDLLRTFADPDLDDTAWPALRVPAHWRTEPGFEATDGPVLYRRRFATPDADPPGEWAPLHTRWWLTLDGAFYSTDVWLDGDYVGDTEGYFFPHTFDVTDQLEVGDEHLLAIEATSAPQSHRTAKRTITGSFGHGPGTDPTWNPGGLWRPVRLHTSGPVRIRHARALCLDASAETASVLLRLVLDTRETRPVELVATIAGQRFVESRPLAAGENRVEWTLTVPDPELWWPRALGDQPLHDLTVTVRTGDGPDDDDPAGWRTSDERTWRIGLRSVQLHDWVLHVNGERIFLKGTNLAPTRRALADATPAELAGDVALAAQAGLDLVRVNAHVTRPELYDAADEAGLLVWQDLPLQWGYARTVRRQARRQAREMVDLLGHHPSVVVWCGHNEPLAVDPVPGDAALARRTARRRAAATVVPTWNKTVLDHSIAKALRRNDPSRPVVPHSGVLPHPPQLDGTDTHLYLGWSHGRADQFPDVLRRWPRLARFVSEFGAQAVPADADFCQPERWPALDWDHLARHHALQKDRFDVHVPPDRYATFDQWRDATQAYQAEVIRRAVEALRRCKYRPTGGFAQYCLADAHPAVSWSVLDHHRTPKAGLAALAAACAPVIVVADPLPPTVAPGDALALDVHVVSDLRAPLRRGVVTARLDWGTGHHHWRWQGDVDADGCARVGTVQAVTAPDARHLELALTYEWDGGTATNRYRAEVAGAGT